MAEVRPESGFVREVEAGSGVRLGTCFQCHKCAAGCPLAFAMDILPDALVRLVQLGQKGRALGSATVWLCAGCQTCATRCPNGVDIPALMDALRQLALAEGARVPQAERGLAALQGLFLDEIRRRGRIHELSLLGRYKAATGNLTADLGLGWQLFRRGRLRLVPRRVKAINEVRRIFEGARLEGAISEGGRGGEPR